MAARKPRKKIIINPGDKFSMLTVIKKLDNLSPNGRVQYLCRCDCGTEKAIVKSCLIWTTKSCGCATSELKRKAALKHGYAIGKKPKIYSIWRAMMNRVNNPNNPSYKNYGGRGITVCDRWHDFIFFKEDMEESFNEHYKIHGEDTSIDRIDNEKNYELSNCRWATNMEQSNNKRDNLFFTYKGETKTLSQWARHLNVNRYALRARLVVHKWPIEKAFSEPLKPANL